MPKRDLNIYQKRSFLNINTEKKIPEPK